PTHAESQNYPASRPFDINRNGFVMGEGAGILVLEEMEAAVKRGVPILAEVCGYGLSGDAYHTTSPHPDGIGAMQSMSNALRDARLDISDIDYVNCHATSTPIGDAIEAKAVATLLEKSTKKKNRPIYISSTKGHTGHLLGAAGSVELAFTALAVQTGVLPATLNLQDIDPAVQFEGLVQHIPHNAINYSSGHVIDSTAVPVDKSSGVRFAMKNSFGFGGTNATIILRNPHI
ncbi:hypothetical protein EON65_15580, partial [archaeon]